MNRLRRLWARILDRWEHRCLLCTKPIARNLRYCCKCSDAAFELKWMRMLGANRTAEGQEE